MEPQQSQQPPLPQADQESGNNRPGGFVSRQTSTRWTPTTDQIRILKDLYYNGGVRSPTADQIQKISARLRQYGKIEGKNVFYWFQNHKARERQKKRFNGTAITTTAATTSDNHHHHLLHHATSLQRASSAYNNNNNDAMINGSSGKLDQDHLFHSRSSYPNFSNGNFYHASSGSECAINTYNGYVGSHGYGSVTMEKQFMDCSISPTGGSSGFNGGNMGYNNNNNVAYSFFNKPKPLFGSEGHDDEEDEEENAYLENRRTLPLFPMHGEDHTNGGGSGGLWKPNQFDGDRRGRVVIGPYASLELSLNSYTGVAPD